MEPHDKGRDQLDQLLDSALGQYGNVEPRPGLEARVLANLAASSGRSRTPSVWAWGLAGAAAMILIIGMWIEAGHRRPNVPALSVRPSVSKTEQKLATVKPPVELNRPAVTRVRSLRTTGPAKVTEPRLQQFPSPRPLSQQEAVVADYVQHFPEEAKLISQEQQKFDEEIQKAQQQIENNQNPDNLER